MGELVPIGVSVRAVRDEIACERTRNALREVRHVIEQRRKGLCTSLQAETRILGVVSRSLEEGR